MSTAITERAFQAKVMQLASMYGWHCAHFRPSMTADGRWLTAISGDAGYPDLTLAHPRRGIIFAELKTDSGRLAPAQHKWLETLAQAARRNTAVEVWRPGDLEQIAAQLHQGSGGRPQS